MSKTRIAKREEKRYLIKLRQLLIIFGTYYKKNNEVLSGEVILKIQSLKRDWISFLRKKNINKSEDDKLLI